METIPGCRRTWKMAGRAGMLGHRTRRDHSEDCLDHRHNHASEDQPENQPSNRAKESRQRRKQEHEGDDQQDVHEQTAIVLRMLMTDAGLTLNRRAVGRMPPPSARASRIRSCTRYGTIGRPILFPFARALACPLRMAWESLARRYAW